MQPAQPNDTSGDTRDLAPGGQLVAPWGVAQLGLDGRAYAPTPGESAATGVSPAGGHPGASSSDLRAPLSGEAANPHSVASRDCRAAPATTPPTASQLTLPGLDTWELVRASGPLFDRRPLDGDERPIVAPELGPYTGKHARIGKCLRCPRGDGSGRPAPVEIVRENDQWRVEGLVQCGTWQCPACGARRAFDAYSVLAPAIAEWGALGEGQDVWLFSPTVRHTRDESIATVNDRLYDAWDNFTESEDWRHWKDANAVRAVVRCYDDTISLDNFHPHFHVLLFVSDCPTLLHPSRSNRATRRRMLRERVEDLLPAWTRACVAAGMPLALTRDEEPELPELRADLGDVAPLDPDVPDWGRRPARAGTWGRKSSRDARSGRSSWEEHALQLQNGDRAAKYVVKWGLAAEASRGDKKDKSHRALLRAYVDGDLRAGARYREWADATYKRHFVTGLSDVRKLVELSQEMIDAHQRERRELIDKEKRERGEPVRAPRANLRMTITPYLFKAALAIGWGDVFVLVEGAEDARLDARAELDRALIECAYRRERVRGPP